MPCVFAPDMVRVRGQGGGLGRSADLVFQSQPKFFKIQPIQPRIQPNFSKKKAWISLDFWLEAERKLFVASGPRAASSSPTICGLSAIAPGLILGERVEIMIRARRYQRISTSRKQGFGIVHALLRQVPTPLICALDRRPPNNGLNCSSAPKLPQGYCRRPCHTCETFLLPWK